MHIFGYILKPSLWFYSYRLQPHRLWLDSQGMSILTISSFFLAFNPWLQATQGLAQINSSNSSPLLHLSLPLPSSLFMPPVSLTSQWLMLIPSASLYTVSPSLPQSASFAPCSFDKNSFFVSITPKQSFYVCVCILSFHFVSPLLSSDFVY